MTTISQLQNICFLDIETVPVTRLYEEQLPICELFITKFERDIQDKPMESHNIWLEKAGLFAEFGKIVCVSIGKMGKEGKKFYIKSFCSRDEKKLLTDLALTLDAEAILCSHNGREFDWPFLFRRYLIHGLPVPTLLNVAGKKTWDVPHIDTMELWSHMQWKYRCSLNLMAYVLGLPSPKKDMDGSKVAEVYYSMFENVEKGTLPFDAEQAALNKISTYCNGDILTLANIFCRIKGIPILKEEIIEYVK